MVPEIRSIEIPEENPKVAISYWKLVALFTALGLVLRLYFAMTLPMGWDGGLYLYWASLVNDGAIPYRDFFVRDPLYIYLLGLSTKTVGQGYLAISLVSALPGAATIIVLYFLGKEISDRSTGLIAALGLAVAPTVIWHSTVYDARTLMLFLASCAMLLLARGLKLRRNGFFFLFGVLLGVSTFVYRAIAIYIVTVPFLFAFLNFKHSDSTNANLKRFLIQTSIALGGYGLGAGTPLVMFSIPSSLDWMVFNFGFGGQQESVGYFIWGQVAGPAFRMRIFFVALREWLYLIAPASIFAIAATMKGLTRETRVRNALFGSLGALFLLSIIVGSLSPPLDAYGAYEPSLIYVVAFFTLLVMFVIAGRKVFPSISPSIFNTPGFDSAHAFLAYWLLSTVVLVAFFGVPLVNYYYFFAPVLTLMAAPIVSFLLRLALSSVRGVPAKRIPDAKPVLFLGLVILSAIATVGMISSSTMTWRNQSAITTYKIASHIEARTTTQEEVLAANPAIALFAHRKIAMGLVEIHLYGFSGPEPFDPEPIDPFNLFPDVAQIAQYMATGIVKYVVGDIDLLNIIKIHPLWQDAFESNFVFETMIDGVPLFVFM